MFCWDRFKRSCDIRTNWISHLLSCCSVSTHWERSATEREVGLSDLHDNIDCRRESQWCSWRLLQVYSWPTARDRRQHSPMSELHPLSSISIGELQTLLRKAYNESYVRELIPIILRKKRTNNLKEINGRFFLNTWPEIWNWIVLKMRTIGYFNSKWRYSYSRDVRTECSQRNQWATRAFLSLLEISSFLRSCDATQYNYYENIRRFPI